MILVLGIVLLNGCKSTDQNIVTAIGHVPVISPDYSGVTIPCNIAPLNFRIQDEGLHFRVRATNHAGFHIDISSSDGLIRFSLKKWKKLIAGSPGDSIRIEILSYNKEGKKKRFDPFFINVSVDSIDPWICYRLLYPGYESWSEMKIVQRSTESFREYSVVENQLLDGNCVNCHTFFQNDPERFFIHVRGSMAGTYFVDRDTVKRIELRTPEMKANAVYPSWHPSGKYIVFSSNKIVQSVHMNPGKDNEFYDVFSSLVFYDVKKNEISSCGTADSVKYMETYPCWSPDGNSLYYCRTEQVEAGFDYRQVKYDLVRRSFDQQTGTFGKAQPVFNARNIDKSISLPAISPDGRYLIFALHDCGSFPVWHKESDLYLLDLDGNSYSRMELNSDETESWHSWSSNGKWLVFSSKRGDGLTSRPYLAYFNSGKTGKPFILPQKDTELYSKMTETFNRPEFITGRVKIGSRDFERASGKKPVKAVWNTEKK